MAVGICAATLTGILLLLRPMSDAVAEVRDTQGAVRLVDAVHAELQGLPLATLESWLTGADVLHATPAGDIVAPRASPLWSRLGPTQARQDAGKFFAVSLLRNPTLSPVGGEPAGSLVFTLRLRWPAHTGDGQPFVDETRQSVLLVPMAVSR